MRRICFIDEHGLVGTCLQEDDLIPCDACEFNPFPKKVVPNDRVLHVDAHLGILLMVIFTIFILCSGCLGISSIDDAKTKILDAISPVVVLKGSAQYERLYPTPTPTLIPVSTVSPIPTPATPVQTPRIVARTVNPYAQGERWQKQWYKYTTLQKTNPFSDVSPKKSLEFGVIVYDHKFLDSYTWWSDAWGQYYVENPQPGNKFLFVWVHEELFGDPKTNIAIMPGIDLHSFVAQNKERIYYNDTGYNPVNLILNFDTKPDYYSISRTSAFGFTRKFIGLNYKYGGWIAEKDIDLYIGPGNSWDGYIIYQVPVSATDIDTFLVGNFGNYGNAYWRFDIYAGN